MQIGDELMNTYSINYDQLRADINKAIKPLFTRKIERALITDQLLSKAIYIYEEMNKENN